MGFFYYFSAATTSVIVAVAFPVVDVCPTAALATVSLITLGAIMMVFVILTN